jgi:hypothetical protein
VIKLKEAAAVWRLFHFEPLRKSSQGFPRRLMRCSCVEVKGLNQRALRVPAWLVNVAHFQIISRLGATPQEPLSADTICSLSNTGPRQLVNTMKRVLLATATILAFAASSFAAEPAKTVGQAPSSGASSFYLAQDTATMKCQIVETQPAAGGSMKVVGAPHTTMASAETALKADKTCK